jgi:hypothetical protein
VGIPQISRRGPAISSAEPTDPRGVRGGVELCKKFSQEGRVLGRDGKNAQTTAVFGDTDILPGHLALTAIAGFIPRPKEGAPALIDRLDHTGRKDTRGHGMGNHSSEDRVYQ